MRRDSSLPEGTVRRLTVDSKVLIGNFLGDSPHRAIDVYIPPGVSGRGLPLLVCLAGYAGSGLSHTNWRNFVESVPERADRLIGSGAMVPAMIAFPDCFTKLGGNQYINSAIMGRWADFLTEEAVPAVEAAYGCGGPGKRGVFGKSSGGYGAFLHALLHPDFWSASACHSGDMGWELLQLMDMPRTLRALAKAGGIKPWLESFFAKDKIKDDDTHVLMVLAMCATYDPDTSAFMGVRLPVDPETCEIIPDRWANWLKWDPLTLVETHAGGLKKLKALYLDCGDIDQYNLLYGARRMKRALIRHAVPHIYEEFSDDHSAIDYRMDRSLPFLSAALTA